MMVFSDCLIFSSLIISYALGLPVVPGQTVMEPSAALPDDGDHLYTLPMFDIRPWERVSEVRLAREGYLYGPPLLGNTSLFPTGVLGDAMVARDKAAWFRDVEYVTNNVYPEWDKAATALAKVCLLKESTPRRRALLTEQGGRYTISLQLRSHLREPMGHHLAGRGCLRDADKLDPGPAVLHGTAFNQSLCGSTSSPTQGPASLCG